MCPDKRGPRSFYWRRIRPVGVEKKVRGHIGDFASMAGVGVKGRKRSGEQREPYQSRVVPHKWTRAAGPSLRLPDVAPSAAPEPKREAKRNGTRGWRPSGGN